MPFLNKGKRNPKNKNWKKNCLSEAKKILFICTVYLGHIYHLMRQLLKCPQQRKCRHKPVWQILSLTSINKTNNSSLKPEKCSTSSIPASVDSSGVRNCPQTRSFYFHKVGSCKSPDSSREKPTIFQEENQKLRTDRVPWRQMILYNKFGALEDMDHVRIPHAFVPFAEKNKKGG